MRSPIRATLLVVLAGIVLAALPAGAMAAEGCYPVGYGVKYKILSGHSKPVVTHAFDLSLAPGGEYSQTTTIGRVSTVSAGVTLEAGAEVEAGNVIAKARIHQKVTLQASGSQTRSSSYTESVTQRNSSRRNREYIVFHGTIRHHGRFVRKTCSYSTYTVIKDFGRWRSWVADVKGTTQCGKRPANAVARRAQKLYCN